MTSKKMPESDQQPTATPEASVGSIMRTILRRSIVALGVMTVSEAIIAWFIVGQVGLFAALMSCAVLVVFTLTTPAVFAVLSRLRVTMAVLLGGLAGSWIIKAIIVVAALMGLRSAMWFNHQLFAIFVAIGAIVVVGIEAHAVLTSRLPYVQPGAGAKKL